MNAATERNSGDNQLILLLYNVITCIYNAKPQQKLTDEKALAEEIIRLMKEHEARVLPVFDKITNPINKCFNLLSWLDNSLNIINTLSNCVVKISEEKSIEQQKNLTFKDIGNILPETRALATLFMREVKPNAQVTLRFDGYNETIVMDENYRFLMTNSMPGAVFGNGSRKCPSRDFSSKLIGMFVLQFFKLYTIMPSIQTKETGIRGNDSWFWNITTPHYDKDNVLLQLNNYITRIENYKNDTGAINYQYGFWHHKESRAINREGNYLLAKQLRSMLLQKGKLDDIYGTYGSINIDKNTHNLKEALLLYRTYLMQEASLNTNPLFEQANKRGINSTELNQPLTSLCAI